MAKVASRPMAALLVVATAGLWVIVSIVTGFPARWETVFQTVVTALTLAMAFVIQHKAALEDTAARSADND